LRPTTPVAPVTSAVFFMDLNAVSVARSYHRGCFIAAIVQC
jgi:hypothetical protein